VLEQSQVSTQGDRLQVRLTIAEQELRKLLTRRIFLSGL
jgi:hypothetical protein